MIMTPSCSHFNTGALSAAALSWMLALWSSLWVVFCGNQWILRFDVTLWQHFCVIWTQTCLVLGLCYSLLVFVHYSSSLIKSCHCSFSVIIVKTIVHKTPNNWAVKVTDASAKRAPMICLFWRSNKSPISPNTCTKHFLYCTHIWTSEYRH